MIILREIWRRAFAPADRRSIQDWAADNVEMPAVLTVRGKFNIRGSRHFGSPLDALRSDRVRGVRLLKPVRGGGTLIADVAVPWAIVNDNASVLWVFQDQPIAEAHAETRQVPILLSVPAIRPMLSLDRHKTRKANILFANGLPFTMQGPAMGGLQSRGFKWVVVDEAWLYKAGVLGQAKGRMGDFVKMASNKFLAISQGGEEDSDWDLELRSAVLFVWHVPCGGCQAMIAPEWTLRRPDGTFAGAVFDTVKHPDGTYDKDASATTVRFVCASCGHAHPNSERTRATWNIGGRYINSLTGAAFDPANPPTECAFRWHSLIDYPWEELVREWLSAQEAKHVGNFAPLINFFQKRCALMRSERTIHETDIPFARVNSMQQAPKDKAMPDEFGRALTADRQGEDVYFITGRAWAKTGESRRLFRCKVYSEAAIEEKRIEYGINPDCTLIDSGYRPKGDQGVYAACIRYGWIAAKGTDEPFFWHSVPSTVLGQPPQRVQKAWAPLTYGDPGEGTSAQGKKRCTLIRFAANVMADRMDALISRGLWTEPNIDPSDEDEREYARQMSAEFKRAKVNKFTGKREMVRVCPSGNNHFYDDGKMQVLFAMSVGCLPAGVELKPEEKPSA